MVYLYMVFISECAKVQGVYFGMPKIMFSFRHITGTACTLVLYILTVQGNV